MTKRKQWSELAPEVRIAIVVGAAVEVVITTVALRDLIRRPAASVRGPKVLWTLGFVVQPFGPLLYLFGGRRRGRP